MSQESVANTSHPPRIPSEEEERFLRRHPQWDLFQHHHRRLARVQGRHRSEIALVDACVMRWVRSTANTDELSAVIWTARRNAGIRA